jgi:hypothetical protein
VRYIHTKPEVPSFYNICIAVDPGLLHKVIDVFTLNLKMASDRFRTEVQWLYSNGIILGYYNPEEGVISHNKLFTTPVDLTSYIDNQFVVFKLNLDPGNIVRLKQKYGDNAVKKIFNGIEE